MATSVLLFLNRYWRAVRKRGTRWKWPRKFLLIKDAPTIDCVCIRMIRVEPPYLLDWNLLSLFMNVCSICQPDASQQSQQIAAGYKDVRSCISSNILEGNFNKKLPLTSPASVLIQCCELMSVCCWFDFIFWGCCVYIFYCRGSYFVPLNFVKLIAFFSSHLKKINKIKHFLYEMYITYFLSLYQLL